MWLYYLLTLFTIILSLTVNTSTEKGCKIYLNIMFSIFAILLMFRSYSVGNDTATYAELFKSINQTQNLFEYIKNSRYEAGFIIIVRFLGRIWSDPRILLMFSGLFCAHSFKRFILTYSDLPELSTLMFLTLGFFDGCISAIRMFLAVSILVYSFEYLGNKRNIYKFICIVLLATSMHNGAILFLLMYPVSSYKYKGKVFLFTGLTAIAVYVLLQNLLSFLSNIIPQYAKYLTDSGDSFSNTVRLASVLMFLMWLFIFVVANVFENNYGDNKMIDEIDTLDDYIIEYKTNYNIHKIGVWMGTLFLFLAFQGTILNRYKYIFSTSIIVYYPNVIYNIQDQKTRTLVVMLSSVLFFLYALIIYIST